MSEPRSVTQWLDQLRRGDEDAARQLWERYFQRLTQLARARMGPVPRQVADEEDVALSVMDYLCRGAEQGRFDQIADRDELWRLLFTITAHKVVEKTRLAARQKRGGGRVRDEASLGQDGNGKIDDVASDEPTPQLLAEMDDEHRRLMEVLGESSLQTAASLRLKGWTNEEIAGELGITRRSVERKLTRIRLIWSAELAQVDHNSTSEGPSAIMNEHETEHIREVLEASKRIDHLCDDFERAWLAGERPRIEAYLDRASEIDRPNLLRELLQVEFDAQLAKGKCPDREQYVRRFPECEPWIDRVIAPESPRGGNETAMQMAEPEPPSIDIDGFRILKELSRGGQAVVYQAIQLSTKQKVALKVLSEGPFLGKQKKRRFEREIELVGGLRHPGIVSIYDSGVSHGRCYYAMEYIRGQTLTRYVQSRELGVLDTLRLFAQVCDAVDYAHQRGVIHRDLKPSNILIDDRGDPHVLDFGLAKIAGTEGGAQSLVSQTGQIVGTPAYMSPEQAAGRPDVVDMRSDVYALGVILYELVTGQPPYDVTGPLGDVLQTIQHAQPKRPSLTGTSVNNEVETIVLKMLDKDKERRYDTAGALRRDIGRYLDGEPIEAKRDSALYVLRKTLRRYRAAAAVAGTILLILFASIVALSVSYSREVAAREKADRATERATIALKSEAIARLETAQQLYVSNMDSAADAWESADLSRLYQLLDRHRSPTNQDDFHGIEWYLLWEKYLSAVRQTRLRHDNEIQSAVFSPDGQTLVTTTKDTIRFWDLATRKVIASHTGGEFRSLVVSPDGKTLASGDRDGNVILWDFATRQKRGNVELEPYEGGISQLAFSPDNRTLVAVGFGDRTSKLWDVNSGNVVHQGIGNARFWGLSAAFSTDSKKLVVGSLGSVHLWDLAHPYDESTILNDGSNIRCVAVSPDGKLLAIGGDESLIRFHDLAQNQQRTLLEGHLAPIRCGAFSADGQLFASGSDDRTVRLWEVETGRETAVLRGHKHSVISVAFSPDGTTLASGSGDNDVILWDVARPDPESLKLHESPVCGLAVSRDATKLASAGFRRHPSLVLWDVASGRGEALIEGDLGTQCVAFSPNHKTLVAGIRGSLHIWDLNKRTHKEHATGGTEITAMAYSPDGSMLATMARQNERRARPIVRIWNTETWSQIKSVTGSQRIRTSLAFSPDGKWLATPTGGSMATIYDTTSWEEVKLKIRHRWPIMGVAFSPDGNRLATVCQEGRIKLWDLITFREEFELIGENSGIYCVAFSPDGNALVTGGVDGRINVWKLNLKKPELVATLRGHGSSVCSVVFSADGRIMATGSNDGTVRVWRTASDEEIELTRTSSTPRQETGTATHQE